MKQLSFQAATGERLMLSQTETAVERMKGLLGKKLELLSGLWILPCNSIHTIGMRYPLDLVYLDKTTKIIKLVENIPAWRFSLSLSAHSVIEFNAGTIKRFDFQLGQTLDIEK